MKTPTAFCLAVLLLAGGRVSARAEEPAASQPPAEEIVHALFAAWSQHDLARIEALFTADGIYEDVPPQRTYRGAEEIQGFLTAIWAWAPDIEFNVTAVAVAGDRAVAEWVMTGTQTGPIGAISASGNEFSVRGASVLEIEDGKITRNSDYYDLSSLLVQFGVRYAAPPPKGQAPE